MKLWCNPVALIIIEVMKTWSFLCGCVWRSLWARVPMGRRMWLLAPGIRTLRLSSRWTRTRQKVRANTQSFETVKHFSSVSSSFHCTSSCNQVTVFTEIHTFCHLFFFFLQQLFLSCSKCVASLTDSNTVWINFHLSMTWTRGWLIRVSLKG